MQSKESDWSILLHSHPPDALGASPTVLIASDFELYTTFYGDLRTAFRLTPNTNTTFRCKKIHNTARRHLLPSSKGGQLLFFTLVMRCALLEFQHFHGVQNRLDGTPGQLLVFSLIVFFLGHFQSFGTWSINAIVRASTVPTTTSAVTLASGNVAFVPPPSLGIRTQTRATVSWSLSAPFSLLHTF